MTTRYFFFVLLAFGFAGSVWAAPFTGTFTKITSTDDLTTGYYVIVGSESSAENADYAMSCEIDNNNRVKVSYISITDGNTITDPSDEVVYYITKKGSIAPRYTCYNESAKKYLYQKSETSGKGMDLQAEGTRLTCTGYNSINPTGFMFTLDEFMSNNVLKYNCESLYFANYSGNYSTYMTPVRLFKLEENQDPGSATEVENTEIEMQAKKIVRDGQILILRGEHTYTIQGQETIVP